MKIRQHIPNFACEGRDPYPEDSFTSRAELDAIPFVAQWLSGGSDLRRDGYRLLAYLNDGKEWWVVGQFTECSLAELSSLGIQSANCPPSAREIGLKVYSPSERSSYAKARGMKSK